MTFGITTFVYFPTAFGQWNINFRIKKCGSTFIYAVKLIGDEFLLWVERILYTCFRLKFKSELKGKFISQEIILGTCL